MQHCFHVVFLHFFRDTILALCIQEKRSPSELVSNGYISNHNKMRRPRPKFKVSFYLYFCCFWINVTQINFENRKKKKIQRIVSAGCFQLKLWFNVDARAPSIPLLNFPFKARIRIGVRTAVIGSILAFVCCQSQCHTTAPNWCQPCRVCSEFEKWAPSTARFYNSHYLQSQDNDSKQGIWNHIHAIYISTKYVFPY